MLPVTQLILHSANMAEIDSQLKNTVQKTPQFFNNMPIVIDLQNIQSADLDFPSLITILKQAGLIPVGISNANQSLENSAIEAGLGVMSSSKKNFEAETKSKNPRAPAKVITTPVRSGQQIYAQGTDLIVLTSVSPGAEIFADGHIHVYGPLRGRALAGVQGDLNAQIFCQSLDAELLSIAGNYKLKDNFNYSGEEPVKVYLKENSLIIESLRS